MERRLSRGESVDVDSQIRAPLALVQHGSGEFFRAMRERQILSSILVLRAPRGAYYHSAGTSREGMALGASHFLIHSVAEILRAEGFEQFNLGGAEASNPGLERFKMGFATRPVHLEAAAYCFSSRFQKNVVALVNLMRQFAHNLASEPQKPAAAAKHQESALS